MDKNIWVTTDKNILTNTNYWNIIHCNKYRANVLQMHTDFRGTYYVNN